MNIQAATDQQLMANLHRLAKDLRTTEVELLAYLNEMQQRQLYALQGYPSLFAYCLKELKFSESTTCRRLAAARVVARFPEASDYLADGRLHITGLAMLEKHLTTGNYLLVLTKATGLTKTELDWLIVELAPRADVPASIRRLPASGGKTSALLNAQSELKTSEMKTAELKTSEMKTAEPFALGCLTAPGATADLAKTKTVSVVQPLTPERVLIKCSADAAVAAKITRVRELLAHKFPRGELEYILDAALEALLEDIAPERKAMRQEKRQQAAVAAASKKKSTTGAGKEASGTAAAQKVSTAVAVKPATPHTSSEASEASEASEEVHKTPSRYIPAAAKLAAWQQCEGQCAYVSPDGRRCRERRALEYDHAMPFALGGASDASNIRCYCRTHNAFAALVTYGPNQPWRHTATPEVSR